eukprot:SM000048S16571  [mRNA]  locus=s48:562075:565641:+ [translate_table: standard]
MVEVARWRSSAAASCPPGFSGAWPRRALRAEELGFGTPTRAQREALPTLLRGGDCVLQSQTGSGKSLCYLLPLLAAIDPLRAAVQAIVVVPTRELGMQVAKLARQLAAGGQPGQSTGSKLQVMALLEGGTLSRQRSWLKAEPPQLVVGTPEEVLRMADAKHLHGHAVRFLVVDETAYMTSNMNVPNQVDAVVEATKLSSSNALHRLLTVNLPPAADRQTVLTSATIPQHRRFVQECVKNKWIKASACHIHVEPERKVPARIQHSYIVCSQEEKLERLVDAVRADRPQAAIIYANDQSKKAKKAGDSPLVEVVAAKLALELQQPSAAAANLLDNPPKDSLLPLGILKEDSHVNARVGTIQDMRDGRCRLLVTTGFASRGLDLPDVSHIYNVDVPPDATSYMHRAGRTGRTPLEDSDSLVTTLLAERELGALEHIANDLLVHIAPRDLPIL